MLQTDQPIREVRGSAHEGAVVDEGPRLATETHTRCIRTPLNMGVLNAAVKRQPLSGWKTVTTGGIFRKATQKTQGDGEVRMKKAPLGFTRSSGEGFPWIGCSRGLCGP